MGRRIVPVLCILLLVALCASTACAQKSLVIDSFHCDVFIMKDGTIDVTEMITARFTGQWNGIYRTIPVYYRTPQGMNYKLMLDMLEITDGQSQALKYKSKRERHYQKFKIWVPGASNTTRTIKLHYQVHNGLKYFEDHDELYWNVTGDEWEVPISYATAKVSLPIGAEGMRTNVFTGGYGSTEQAASIEEGEGYAFFATLRPLRFREGMTIAVAWNPGAVERPGVPKKIWWFLLGNWPFFIPLIVLGVMLWLWHEHGKDPHLRPIAAQYEPPEGMTPAEAGTLVDNAADMRDITATLVDLAVRGFIVIESKEKEHWTGLGFLSKMDYTFRLLKKEPEWSGVKPHERALLKALFLGDTLEFVTLESLQNKFYKDIPKIRDSVYSCLLNDRCYLKRPDTVKKEYIGYAIAAGVVTFVLATLGAKMTLSLPSIIVPGALSALIIAGIGWFMPTRTFHGARWLEHVLGFEEFLDKVESDRFARVVKTPEMFEKFLPYAMALGVEQNWARAFEGIYREQPQWYRGGDFRTFHTRSFMADMTNMSTAATTAMTSAPRSSGGSGFGGGGFGGGGGFSGGGFGGGGGGGF